MLPPSRTVALVAAWASLVAACNAITGVDQLTTTVNSTNPGTGGANGTTGSTSGGGSGGTGTGTTGPAMAAAPGLTISQIAIYQGPKRALVGGAPSPSGLTVPIVAGRDALVRVFVDSDASYDGGPVTARLHLGSSAPLEITAPVTTADEASLGSTINFEVPGERLVPGVDYRVELLQPAPGQTPAPDNPGARHPADGTAKLDVQANGDALKIVIVPVQYDADGSHRLPDTSPAKIQGYKDWFFARYPARTVDLTVHDPWPYSGAVYEFGFGWGALLDAILELRIDEGADPGTYYFGIVQPAPTFGTYCIGSCTTGLANVGGANDEYAKAGVGLGYPGEDTLGTAVHEIGHALGRYHAPCGGASNADSQYPYAGGRTGVWGYDLVAKQLVAPDEGRDLMGYCDPYWVSDYTFLGLFQRMKAVNGAAQMKVSGAPRVTWERARLEIDGSLTWLRPVSLARPPVGEATPVTVQRAGGANVVAGQFFPYDHLAGGVLLWPAASAPIDGITVTLGGKARALSR